ncbi:MAG: hypothetical protein SGPRY_010009 [Prymnesium sp.]
MNEASRFPHILQHFLYEERTEFHDWLDRRGLVETWSAAKAGTPLEWLEADEGGRISSNFLGEPVYIFGDDIKDYFNQLAIATSDLWQLGILFIRQPEDVLEFDAARVSRIGHALLISELRLGFGTHGASNVTQRFSDAIMHQFRDRMDEAEAEASRTPLEEERVAAQNSGYDPIFVVVGVERALRALKAWRAVTSDLQLIMAIPKKRTLGSWVTRLGVLVFALPEIVAIPRAKLLRARAIIAQSLWTVLCDELMHKQLTRWLALVLHSMPRFAEDNSISAAAGQAGADCGGT